MKNDKRSSNEPRASLRDRFGRSLETLLACLDDPDRVRAGPWIVALSAGCDSTVLSCLLHETVSRPAVTAVHINHGLRGADADADEAAAQALAVKLGFGFRAVRLTPPAGLATGATEAWARSERYQALDEAAHELDAPLVLTAHNRNDQAETVLARFMRRAGYWGLAGIRPWRRLAWGSPVLVARPLLAFARAELERCLAERGQDYQRDSTNEETAFTRNRIRHTLLPRLAQADTLCGDVLVHTLNAIADLSRAIHLRLDEAADAMIEQGSFPNVPLDRITCDRDLFERSPELVRFAFLRRAVLLLAPRQVPIKQHTFRDINASISSGAVNKKWSLGRGLVLRCTKLDLAIEPNDEEEDASANSRSWQLDLPVPGVCELPDGRRIRAAVYDDPAEAQQPQTDSSPSREILDGELIGPSLSVRVRRPGDTFHPLGAPGGKKLKSFLIDAKIPAGERDAIPLVCDRGEIVWVAGVRIAHTVRVTGSTARFVCLTLEN